MILTVLTEILMETESVGFSSKQSRTGNGEGLSGINDWKLTEEVFYAC